MDPITAVGFAAAVVQLVELGTKVTQRLADYSAAAFDGDPPRAFKQIATVLPVIISGLQRMQADASANHLSVQTADALDAVVESCLLETQELDRILRKALPSADASKWERRGKAVLSLKYDSKIDKIAKTMDGYINTLVFHQVISQNIQVEEPPPYRQAPFWLVPHGRNALFVGRDAIFQRIDEELTVMEGVQPKAALCGLGGIGKSQIALEYCYRKRRKGERCSVFWANAATVTRFEESLNCIAQECGVSTGEGAGKDVIGMLKSWLELRHDGPWLMVIDNVDNGDVFFKERMRTGQTPSEWTPCNPQGSLLFTTRNRDVAVDVVHAARPIHVDEMSTAEGLELARARIPIDTSEEVLVELLEALEFIPLAITQASAFMTKRRKTVQHYLAQYQNSDATRAKLLSFEFSDHGRQGSSMESVAKTWMMSFEAIRESNLRAAGLLCQASFFQHHGIPAALLQNEGEDDFDFQEAAAVLKAFSFLDADDADSVFRTHRLVQLATRWWLERESRAECERWALAAFRSVARQFPGLDVQRNSAYASLSQTMLPHAELMLQHKFQISSREVELARASLLNSTGRYLRHTGANEESVLRFEESREIHMRYLGEAHLDTMASAGLLGSTLARAFRDPTAIPILERVAEFMQETLGPNHFRTVGTLCNLAYALSSTDDWRRAVAMQRKLLDRSVRHLGRQHGDTLVCMHDLAVLLHQHAEYDEAVNLQREVYSTSLQLFGPLDKRVHAARGNFAILLSSIEGSQDDAYELMKVAVQKSEENFGPDNYLALQLVYALAVMLKNRRRLDEAREVLLRSLMNLEDRKNLPHVQEFKRRVDDLLEGLDPGTGNAVTQRD